MALGAYLTSSLSKGGVRYPAGTKVSDIPGELSDHEKERLERLDLTGSKKEAEKAAPEPEPDDELEPDDSDEE